MLAGIAGCIGALGNSATGGGATWTTTFSQAISSASGGWNGSNLQQVLNSSLLSTSGTQVRVTLKSAPALNNGWSIDSCFIGHQAASGDPYDFDGGQVRLTVVGSNSFSLASGSLTLITDAVSFAPDHTKNLIIAAHFNDASTLPFASLSGATNYCKDASSDETSVSNVSGMGSNGAALALVNDGEYSSTLFPVTAEL
ncbi:MULTISPECIES: hypothetical protein [unclassified Bradyrhizobium]|uniref:hypothetical protein n=1 Tax=unclassified Bradyrhizobium TaxID=2631580 RepID=UPI00247869FD|nr:MULTISPECIES: hypothetical protein [unclassified Bradyrhizobium]WGR70484.1 hypothetical protein MTX24_34875 [Bradyrhizobium sp. ISRA426]WGR82540.1 hypothetical protein MTX21_19975 [Bradyrhizobium sp. ISRA430]WGR85727.1 hypothetical protein MTX25_34560 [Bradyrhizobium sp. ISRA432]